MQLTLKTLGLLAVAGLLTACGQTPIERGATGAIGGAAIATVLDEDVGDAALAGAAVGAFAPCILNPNTNGCY